MDFDETQVAELSTRLWNGDYANISVHYNMEILRKNCRIGAGHIRSNRNAGAKASKDGGSKLYLGGQSNSHQTAEGGSTFDGKGATPVE